MSYSNSDPPRSSCCSTSNADSTELKLYQAFIFSVTIFFTFVLLFLFYLFYLRRRRVDWSSLRMRASVDEINNDISNQSELGLKKELREMLPIVVYMESFSVKDTQCSVCLLDYQAEDRLQQIPACGHTFHMNCIDLWLSNNSTCPLCRMSLLASARSSEEPACIQRPQVYEETPTTEFFQLRSTSHSGKSIFQNCSKEDSIGARCTNHERDLDDT